MVSLPKFVWLDGEMVESHLAQVPLLTHSLHYGTAFFEGIRVYLTPSGPRAFRLEEHCKRLLDSAKIYGLTSPYDQATLVDAVAELVRVNGLVPCYVRPLLFIPAGPMGLDLRDREMSLAIANWEWGVYLGEESKITGIRLMVSSWTRPHINSSPPASKASANYLNACMAKTEALKAGFDEAIMLTDSGRVSEGSAENIVLIFGDELVTPPLTDSVLDGLTKRSVMQIAKRLGLTWTDRSVTRAELYSADGVLVCGTATEVVPVQSIDGRELDVNLRVIREIQAEFDKATMGLPPYEDWSTPID